MECTVAPDISVHTKQHDIPVHAMALIPEIHLLFVMRPIEELLRLRITRVRGRMSSDGLPLQTHVPVPFVMRAP